MKLAPSYISKERLLSKIADRNEKRIAEHITVSSAFRPEDSKIIKDNLDSIARFAERKSLNLGFEPSSENLSTAKMNVYKQSSKLVNTYDGFSPDTSNIMLLPSTDYVGSAKLPDGINSKEKLMDAIRKSAAEVLYKPHLNE